MINLLWNLTHEFIELAGISTVQILSINLRSRRSKKSILCQKRIEQTYFHKNFFNMSHFLILVTLTLLACVTAASKQNWPAKMGENMRATQNFMRQQAEKNKITQAVDSNSSQDMAVTASTQKTSWFVNSNSNTCGSKTPDSFHAYRMNTCLLFDDGGSYIFKNCKPDGAVTMSVYADSFCNNFNYSSFIPSSSECLVHTEYTEYVQSNCTIGEDPVSSGSYLVAR